MALPKPKPWPTELHSFFGLTVPTAVGGVVPGWSTMVGTVIAAYNSGKLVTYFDGSQIYYLTAVTSNELRFEGRFAYQYPNNTSATQYMRSINRSSGAVTNHTIRFTISNYT